MAPWKAQRTKAAPSVSEQSDTQSDAVSRFDERACFTAPPAHAALGVSPRSRAKGHLKKGLPGRTGRISDRLDGTRTRDNAAMLSGLIHTKIRSVRLKMYAHLARCAGRTPAKWDLLTLRNISQRGPGTDRVFPNTFLIVLLTIILTFKFQAQCIYQ